jgi:hypothetical protein
MDGTALVSVQENWTAAVRMVAGMGQRIADQLRALEPRPFGLVNDVLRLPAYVGSHHQVLSFDPIAGLSLPGTLASITLCYGIPEDPLSPYLEVLTDFTPDHQDTVHLRSVLGEAVGQESSRQSGCPERGGRRHQPPRGSLRSAPLDIVVAGQALTVGTQSYQGFQGLRFSHSGLVVTVIARGNWPDHPVFDWITDFEPYLTAIESPDSEVVTAKARALLAARPTPMA